VKESRECREKVRAQGEIRGNRKTDRPKTKIREAGWRRCCGGACNVATGNFFAGLWACSRGRVRESEEAAESKDGE